MRDAFNASTLMEIPILYSLPMSKATVTLIRNTLLSFRAPTLLDAWNPNNKNEKLLCGKIGKETLTQLLTFVSQFGVCDLEWNPNTRTISQATLVIVHYDPLRESVYFEVICHSEVGLIPTLHKICKKSCEMPIFFDDPCNDILVMEFNGFYPMLGYSPLDPVGVWDCQSVCASEYKKKSKHTSRGDTFRTTALLFTHYLSCVHTSKFVEMDSLIGIPYNEGAMSSRIFSELKKTNVRSLNAFKFTSKLLKGMLRPYIEINAIPCSIEFEEFRIPEQYRVEELENSITRVTHLHAPETIVSRYDRLETGEYYYPYLLPKNSSWVNFTARMVPQSVTFSNDSEESENSIEEDEVTVQMLTIIKAVEKEDII
jgi:hypothetical protein